jgi:SAM-dependent methyltransferase
MGAVVALTEVKAQALARRAKTICPCCGEEGGQIIYRVPSIPVHSCVLLDTVAAARAYPRRDLELAFCDACGFVFNHIFDETAIGYSTNFEESQHFSSTFSSFARTLAREIVEKCTLTGKDVLEIGCGKGEFLFELCSAANASGIGIDPGYRADQGRGAAANLRFIVDYYGPKYRDIRADLVLCRHALEHIKAAGTFVRSIRDAVGEREDVWIVFETPDAMRVLSEGAFWDIYYEHCSYFSAGAHARLFRREWFDVTDLSLVYDGQYIVQYARPAQRATEPRLAGEHDLATMRALAATFPTQVGKTRKRWHDRIRAAAARDQSVVLWGGGSKAVSFLTTLGLEDEVSAVVDVNPYKQGKFLPGTAHEVIAPSALSRIRPDFVVVMNSIYMAEIGATLRDLNLAPKILAV